MKKPSGLIKRGKVWHMEKKVRVPRGVTVNGRDFIRVRGSTHTSDMLVADVILKKAVDDSLARLLHGQGRDWLFETCVDKFLTERSLKKQGNDEARTKVLLRHLKGVPIRMIHSDCKGVKELIKECRGKRNSPGTINHHLGTLGHILRLAHTVWKDEDAQPYLKHAVTIVKVGVEDKEGAPEKKVKGYPINKEQENKLLEGLNRDLWDAIVFVLHTGLRNTTVCNLKWEHIINWADDGISTFDLPAGFPGLKVEDLAHRVVLNTVAQEVIERKWGEHPTYVFTYEKGGQRLPYHGADGLRTSQFCRARKAAGLNDIRSEVVTARGGSHLRVHDLRHTYASRLRAMGVAENDVGALLGHRGAKVTTDYTAPETFNLIEASQQAVEWYKRKSSQAGWFRGTVAKDGQVIMSHKYPTQGSFVLEKQG